MDAGPIWMNAQLNEHNEGGNARLIYFKGAYIMEMLRALLFDPRAKNPDSRFIAMLHDFASAYAGQNASTDDFRKIVEKHFGKPMGWFFNQWVYGTEIPTYNFSYQLSDAEGGQTELSMSIEQSGVSESFQMQVPVYLMIKGELRSLGLIGAIGTKPNKASLKLPMRPEKVVLDPNRSILADIHQ